MAEAPSLKPTIILIHGLWMTPLSWEDWITHYRNKEYEVLAPGWPGIDERTPTEVRADPRPLANKTITDIVDHYETIIRGLPTPPIIIGHSFGGLFTQILLSRGLGCAGVGISPAPPAGILSLPLSTLRATFPVLRNPLHFSSTVQISANQFHYCFGNHLSQAESNALYDRYAIPSVARVLWQGALGGLSKSGPAHVEFDKSTRAPLLLISGTNDHVVTQSTVEKEFAMYDKGPTVVELKVFEGRTHGIINQEGWEEVADFALEFCEGHLGK
ncbi:Alpha/Beta hydrolase protein [Aspergillus arachidicola]|uniref:Alpha/Beta hydrolase protein n=1 Tax=Aspergillus arachidicola TaxID=656916 RepID=A0A5N6XNB1_9EURO|nr:Alpha/Beta hydrolase protein [Aspergillus arachidicola]